MDLIQTASLPSRPTAALSDHQRELLPLAFDSFLDSVATATGRGTFYNSREEQAAAVEAAHRDLFDIDRDVYIAALMLPGVTDLQPTDRRAPLVAVDTRWRNPTSRVRSCGDLAIGSWTANAAYAQVVRNATSRSHQQRAYATVDLE